MSKSIADQLITAADNALKALFSPQQYSQRENPATGYAEPLLSTQEKKQSAALMRVNHAGEVCAQALYQGQAFTAQSVAIKKAMKQSGDEEIDHLAWCQQRIKALDSHTSYLNPLWYAGSFFIGAVAGLIGDKWSLGFVVETERQVDAHLEGHLQSLPATDTSSRVIIQQMQFDEREHASKASQHGAEELPGLVKQAMRLTAKVMTATAYWV